jgi:hypothetical protein
VMEFANAVSPTNPNRSPHLACTGDSLSRHRPPKPCQVVLGCNQLICRNTYRTRVIHRLRSMCCTPT